MSAQHYVAVLTILAVFFVCGGFSLQCYNCDSPECNDPFNISKAKNQTCLLSEKVCIKLIYTTNKTTTNTVRQCHIEENTCNELQNLTSNAAGNNTIITFGKCTVCNKDFCNSSATLEKSFALYAVLFVFGIVSYLKAF